MGENLSADEVVGRGKKITVLLKTRHVLYLMGIT